MQADKKRFVFLVQGEGRGHMTQAISLYQILEKNGHEISHVFIGRSKRRKIPAYFYESIRSPITELDSPNFITDEREKSIREWRQHAIINIKENSAILEKAKDLNQKGIRSKDALHIACAISAECKYFLTTDDRILNKNGIVDPVHLNPPAQVRRRSGDFSIYPGNSSIEF